MGIRKPQLSKHASYASQLLKKQGGYAQQCPTRVTGTIERMRTTLQSSSVPRDFTGAIHSGIVQLALVTDPWAISNRCYCASGVPPGVSTLFPSLPPQEGTTTKAVRTARELPLTVMRIARSC